MQDGPVASLCFMQDSPGGVVTEAEAGSRPDLGCVYSQLEQLSRLNQ